MIVRKIERRPSDRIGFTLMEVLVVVAILVVLAGTASIFVFRYLDDAKKQRAQSDLQTLTNCCMTYKIKYDEFPQSLNLLVTPPDGGQPYVSSPDNIIDPWGKPYQYDPNGTNNGGLKPDIWTVTPDNQQVGDRKSTRLNSSH